MTDSQFTRLQQQLKDSYEDTDFELVDSNCVPEIDDLGKGEAAKLDSVGFGFFDIRGFTNWSRTKRDKSVFKVLQPTLETLTRVVRLHDGTVEKPTGDGLMFVVGAGETDKEKIAVRTLQCALDIADLMQNAVNPFLQQKRHITEPFGWGIGVDMGRALIAKVGIRHHYHLTSIARAANFASKLENETTSGTILAGKNIFDAAPDTVSDELEYYGIVHGEDAYRLKYEQDDDGRMVTLAKSMTGEQVRRFNLSDWLLGGAVSLGTTSVTKGVSSAKPQRWYGGDEE